MLPFLGDVHVLMSKICDDKAIDGGRLAYSVMTKVRYVNVPVTYNHYIDNATMEKLKISVTV